jgi:hypothetical protein
LFTKSSVEQDAYNHRLRLVQSARLRGIKPTARLFQTTVPTVRKWLRRYQLQGPRFAPALLRASSSAQQNSPRRRTTSRGPPPATAHLRRSPPHPRVRSPPHQAILNNHIPLSIGGGIGQSRTLMLLLKKAHLGEVTVTVWPKVLKEMCAKKNIFVLE